jgi:hypothetical protein
MKRIEAFIESKGNLKGFRALFESDAIREKCLNFYSSKYIVECILGWSRVGVHKKLLMLKYV